MKNFAFMHDAHAFGMEWNGPGWMGGGGKRDYYMVGRGRGGGKDGQCDAGRHGEMGD